MDVEAQAHLNSKHKSSLSIFTQSCVKRSESTGVGCCVVSLAGARTSGCVTQSESTGIGWVGEKREGEDVNSLQGEESLLHCKESLLHCEESLLHCEESLLHCEESLLHCGQDSVEKGFCIPVTGSVKAQCEITFSVHNIGDRKDLDSITLGDGLGSLYKNDRLCCCFPPSTPNLLPAGIEAHSEKRNLVLSSKREQRREFPSTRGTPRRPKVNDDGLPFPSCKVPKRAIRQLVSKIGSLLIHHNCFCAYFLYGFCFFFLFSALLYLGP